MAKISEDKKSTGHMQHHSFYATVGKNFLKNSQGVFGLTIIVILIFAAVFAPLLTAYDPIYDQNYEAILLDPGGNYLMGTDELGRDTFARLIYGARLTMAAALIPVTLALVIGVPIGLFTGYKGGIYDQLIIMRLVDAFQAFPSLILALGITAVMGGGFSKALIAIGIGFLPTFIRLTRSEVLAVKNLEYIEAAKSIGCSNLRIAFVHILPNILPTLFVQTTLAMASAIIIEAGLSYVGLGASPEQPSWGSMLKNAQSYMSQQPWLAVWPGISISLVVLGFNLLGDGLRKAIDPRVKQ